jgi:hypothetical protein
LVASCRRVYSNWTFVEESFAPRTFRTYRRLLGNNPTSSHFGFSQIIGWKAADIQETKPPDLEFAGAGDPVSKTGRVLLGLCDSNNIRVINSIQWPASPSAL